MSNWGQGAKNNSNGWGQGATNNTIAWGKIHADSYGHPQTDLVGEGFAPEVLTFIARVESDGGTNYSNQCVNTYYNKYVTPIIILSLTFGLAENSQYLTLL